MLPLTFANEQRPLRVLCLGAHSDDIEIGCAGTLLRWAKEHAPLAVTWVVLSACGERATEARRSAQALLGDVAKLNVVLGDFQDAHLPADFRGAKQFLAEVRQRGEVDVVLTHALDDRHQDHRLVAELTWQVWRDHLVFHYEIPKYEGDLGRPNVFVPLPAAIADRKVKHLLEHFASQRSKDWFSADAFQALMRLRGLECRASSGLAEAFHVHKAVL